jgi:ribose transport system permease protein
MGGVALGILGGLAVGAFVGFVNGLVTVWVGVPAFIATLGMMYIANGLNRLICKGYSIALPDGVKDFGNAEPFGISWSFVLFAAAVIVGDLCLRFTVFGRMAYATGGNREVARIAGINTSAVKIGCFMLTGALASAAGILAMARMNVGDPAIGTGWELEVIASVVIGGISLFGGIGTVAGALLGLLLMQVVKNGLFMVGLNPHWQTVAVGLIMILAVGFDLLRRRTKT